MPNILSDEEVDQAAETVRLLGTRIPSIVHDLIFSLREFRKELAQAKPDYTHPDANGMRLRSPEEITLRQMERVRELETELAKVREAIGLMTTIKGDMEVNVNDPLGMAQEVATYVERLKEGKQ